MYLLIKLLDVYLTENRQMSLIQFTSCPCNFSSNLRIGINFFSKMMCQIMCYYMALSTTTYSLGVALYFDRDTHHYHKNVPTYLGFTLHVCTHNTTHVGIQKYERHLRILPSYIIILKWCKV